MIAPAIHFKDNCLEAIEFYEKVFEVSDKQIYFRNEAPDNSGIVKSEKTKNLVMHSGMNICGTYVNMCDTSGEVISGNQVILNVYMPSDEDVINAYQKLKEGGEIIVEAGPQFFSPMYASVKDRFGVQWQLMSQEA